MSIRHFRKKAASLRTGIRMEILGLDFKIFPIENLILREFQVSRLENFAADSVKS